MSLAGRGEGRPGGGIARELRELRRFHAPVALSCRSPRSRSRRWREGDGEALGRSASCGASWPYSRGRSLRRSFFGDLPLRPSCGRLPPAAVQPPQMRFCALPTIAPVAARIWVVEDETAASFFAGEDGRFVPAVVRPARPPVYNSAPPTAPRSWRTSS